MMIVVEFAKELGDARSIVLGLSIVLFVVFLPKGIAGGVGGLRAIISRPAGRNRSTTATDTHQ
jgi:branched-chain amino acid transport system permease protein